MNIYDSEKITSILENKGLKQNKVDGIKVEGQGGDDWVLVDAGDVIVHLMSAEAREFYDLESLWDPDL